MNKQMREKVQAKSKELGRCICSLPIKPFTCPCKFFTDKGICKCAGEETNTKQQEWAEYNLTNNK